MKNKIVKESLSFTEDSDPIEDMEIGMMKTVKEFVKSVEPHVDINSKENLLLVCAKRGKIDFVEYLLDKGVNVHVDNDKALRWACYGGYIEVVKILLAAGADVNAYDELEKDTPLNEASFNGHLEIVKLLLAAGADVNAGDKMALFWASYKKHIEIVKLLLDAGADVHANNDYALRHASNNGHTEIVKLFLDANDNDKMTPGMYTAFKHACANGFVDIVKLFLALNLNISNIDDGIILARENGHIDVIRLLRHYLNEKK